MYILDTCIIRYWTLSRSSYPKLVAEMNRTPSDCLFITTITVVEMWRGAIRLVDEARASKDQDRILGALDAAEEFRAQLDEFPTLSYDADAHAEYLRIRQARQRIKKPITQRIALDIRIAATALARDYVVVTANVKDFSGISGLRVEDWTR